LLSAGGEEVSTQHCFVEVTNAKTRQLLDTSDCI
jgi:hypothetical protein